MPAQSFVTQLNEQIAHEFAAHQQYVAIAVHYDDETLPRLAQLRSTLRDRMKSSAFMDAPRFARNVEQAYRQMWRAWCAKQCSLSAS